MSFQPEIDEINRDKDLNKLLECQRFVILGLKVKEIKHYIRNLVMVKMENMFQNSLDLFRFEH